MKKKYLMGGGLAFSEESDMKKLKDYAKKGWLLEGIKAGLWYQLIKSEPQDIDYTVDYQSETDDEYFSLFAQAGWQRVVSIDDIHIFKAQEGTLPIYSDKESIIDKYERIKSYMGRGAVSFLIAHMISIFAYHTTDIKYISTMLFLLSVLTLILTIFCLMPYGGYIYRLRKLKKVNNEENA